MRLLESALYKADLLRAVGNSDLTKLDGKNIFITGGLGLIGSAIVDVLVTYNKIDKVYVGARNEKEFRLGRGVCRVSGRGRVERGRQSSDNLGRVYSR